MLKLSNCQPLDLVFGKVDDRSLAHIHWVDTHISILRMKKLTKSPSK